MNIQGSRTEANVIESLMSEVLARNCYTMAASQARQEGFQQIAEYFEQVANHEKEHAKRLCSFMRPGLVPVQGEFHTGPVGSTGDNLRQAAEDENEGWSLKYRDYGRIAREEGFDALALVFEALAVAERQHEAHFRSLLVEIENGTVFRRKRAVLWRCRNCGYVHEGEEAPDVCPGCAHPRAYFEVLQNGI